MPGNVARTRLHLPPDGLRPGEPPRICLDAADGDASWDFSTEPVLIQLDWMDTFIREQIEPVDVVLDLNVYQQRKGLLRAY
jgi:hypothetical protein